MFLTVQGILRLMREKGLGEGDSGFMVVLNTVVELVLVNLFLIYFVQLGGNQDGSWVKEWGEECRNLNGKVTLSCVCVLTAKWALGCLRASPSRSIVRHT